MFFFMDSSQQSPNMFFFSRHHTPIQSLYGMVLFEQERLHSVRAPKTASNFTAHERVAHFFLHPISPHSSALTRLSTPSPLHPSETGSTPRCNPLPQQPNHTAPRLPQKPSAKVLFSPTRTFGSAIRPIEALLSSSTPSTRHSFCGASFSVRPSPSLHCPPAPLPLVLSHISFSLKPSFSFTSTFEPPPTMCPLARSLPPLICPRCSLTLCSSQPGIALKGTCLLQYTFPLSKSFSATPVLPMASTSASLKSPSTIGPYRYHWSPPLPLAPLAPNRLLAPPVLE